MTVTSTLVCLARFLHTAVLGFQVSSKVAHRLPKASYSRLACLSVLIYRVVSQQSVVDRGS